MGTTVSREGLDVSLNKRCSRALETADPLHCATSPRCEHHWHYDFRVNGRRYREHDGDRRQAAGARTSRRSERSRILDGRHGIRRQPDITFRAFAETYLRDHAELHKRSVDRDREILKVLNRVVRVADPARDHGRIGSSSSSANGWRGSGAAHEHDGAAEADQAGAPSTASSTRCKSMLSKAVEWGKLLDSPARGVKRLKVDNRRTRILTDDEQRRLLEACPRKLRAIVTLALMTGARIGELLALRWEHCQDGDLTFLETKNGKARRIPDQPGDRGRPGGTAAGPPVGVHEQPDREAATRSTASRTSSTGPSRAPASRTGDVTLHTLRHTALSRMIAGGYRRLHGDGDLRPLVDADARAVHASDRRAEDRRARTLPCDGHNQGTTRRRR